MTIEQFWQEPADLIKAWARHVDEAKHFSHKQNGAPLFDLTRDARKIECKAPGCPWVLTVKKRGSK